MLRRLGAFFLDILQVIIFAGAIFLILYLLVMQPHKIKGQSMEPNFHDGEYLLTDKLSYRFKKPNRGDVIIFKAPGTTSDDFIKRIIGLPGDTVSVKGGEVYVNNSLLSEKYLPDSFTTNPGVFAQENVELKVPENKFFVLGDNRNHSSDSRAFGFIEKSTITGRAWLLYWPIKNAGVIRGVNYNN